MADNKRSDDFNTPELIFAFTNGVFELQEMENGGKQWNVSGLIPKSANLLGVFEQAALKVATEQWGANARQMIIDKMIKSPILDGDGPQGKSKKEPYAPHKGFPGHWFIRFSSGPDYRPKLVDRQVLPILDKAGFPSGSRGIARVNAYTWTNKQGGKGVSFGISAIQVTRIAQGEEVLGGGGGADPTKVFEKIADEGDAPASTKSGDGAAGLFS